MAVGVAVYDRDSTAIVTPVDEVLVSLSSTADSDGSDGSELAPLAGKLPSTLLVVKC